MITALRRLAAPAIVMATACSRPARGQGTDPELEVQRRNNCRVAEQALGTGRPHPHRGWALRFLAQCEENAPVALVAVWRTVSAESEIDPLVRTTLQIRDARLYQQLRETAADRSRPADVRVAAMLVLIRYTDKRNALWLSDLVPPDSIRRIPLILSYGTGLDQLSGDAPLNEPIAASVLSLFEEIAVDRKAEPKHVWYAAAVLAERLRRDMRRGFAH